MAPLAPAVSLAGPVWSLTEAEPWHGRKDARSCRQAVSITLMLPSFTRPKRAGQARRHEPARHRSAGRAARAASRVVRQRRYPPDTAGPVGGPARLALLGLRRAGRLAGQPAAGRLAAARALPVLPRTRFRPSPAGRAHHGDAVVRG